MSTRKQIAFLLIIILFFFGIIYLTTMLNASSFSNSCVEAGGESVATILETITDRIEYGLRYGKSLNNYYDIEDIFEDARKYCDADVCYITDEEGNVLYNDGTPEEVGDVIERMNISSEHRSFWEEGDTQHVLIRIGEDEDTAGFFGISFQTAKLRAIASPYTRRMKTFALIIAVIGAVLFIVMFKTIKHEFDIAMLRQIVLAVLVVVNMAVFFYSWFVLRAGYRDIAGDVAETLLEKSVDDMNGLIENGVRYSDILNAGDYFGTITENSNQVQSIQISGSEYGGKGRSRELVSDDTGDRAWIYAEISNDYVSGKVKKALLSILVTTIMAVMVSIEILIFLLGVLIDKKRERIKKQPNNEDRTIESIGIVRGLSFFFAAFRYMSAAFMSIVLTEIYRPIYIFGYQVPYEVVISLPLSSQIFISMITSYLSGQIISKKGWKSVTLSGVLIMAAGTLMAAFSKDPVPFIIAQMIMGTGLGFAKMGVDLYAVAVCSERDMNLFTANANASIIVGFSCSASLGALIANTFGYSGAYVVMTIMGICLFFILYFFGMNVEPRNIKKNDDTGKAGEKQKLFIDMRFIGYILLIVIPYFFIMMFVDYFYPVFANSNGITTDMIGYVMLAYGMATAYLGTFLCERISKIMSAEFLMPVILLLLAVSFLTLGITGGAWFAAAIVILIGICDGIMPSMQVGYVYRLPLSRKLGFSRVAGIQGVFSSLIGAAAPVIFGIVMMHGTEGLKIAAILIIVCAVVFYVLNRGAGVVKRSGKK